MPDWISIFSINWSVHLFTAAAPAVICEIARWTFHILYIYFCYFFMSITRRRLRQKNKKNIKEMWKYHQRWRAASHPSSARKSKKYIGEKLFPLLYYILILSRLVFRNLFIFFYSLARAWKGTVWHATAQQHYPNTRTRSYRQSTKKNKIYIQTLRRLIYFVLLFDYFNLSRSYIWKILRSFVKVTITINTS